MIVGYYHPRWTEQVASRVTERLKSEDLRKLGNLREVSKVLLI